jgi:hypothetical protein
MSRPEAMVGPRVYRRWPDDRRRVVLGRPVGTGRETEADPSE